MWPHGDWTEISAFARRRGDLLDARADGVVHPGARGLEEPRLDLLYRDALAGAGFWAWVMPAPKAAAIRATANTLRIDLLHWEMLEMHSAFRGLHAPGNRPGPRIMTSRHAGCYSKWRASRLTCVNGRAGPRLAEQSAP